MDHVRWCLRGANVLAHDVSRLTGIRLEDRSSVTDEEASTLWQAVEALTETDHIGHRVGVEQQLPDLVPVSLLVAYATDVRQALANIRVAEHLLPGVLRFVETASGLDLEYRSALQTRHHVECLFASLVTLLRLCAVERVCVARLELRFPPPPNIAPYEEHYGLEPVWSSESNVMSFGTDALVVRMRGADPSLNASMLEALRATLAVQSPPPIRRRIAVALRDGSTDIESVARRLGMSRRTLQRKLAEHGLRFSDLRADTLRVFAQELLAEGKSVEAVAERLGYASRESFERAFRAWTGSTPADWRKSRR